MMSKTLARGQSSLHPINNCLMQNNTQFLEMDGHSFMSIVSSVSCVIEILQQLR